MNTKEIMQLALNMSGFIESSGESTIFNHGEFVKKILFGIDIYKEDLIKAKEEKYDLVISHHPPLKNYTEKFTNEIKGQIQFLINAGVKKQVAEKTVQPTIDKFSNWNKNKDHNDIIDYSKKLQMPLMNIHQPLDEIGRKYIQDKINSISKDTTVFDFINFLNEIDEFKKSSETIELISGNLKNKIGKTIFFHGVGTNGGYSAANILFDSGYNTVVYIHLLPYQEKERARLKKENKGNLLILGHYVSDSLGINIFINKLIEKNLVTTKINNLI